MTLRIAGTDGCSSGWLCIEQGENGLLSPRLHHTTSELLAYAGTLDLLTIDIPIGLRDDGPRQVDILARRLLGPRASRSSCHGLTIAAAEMTFRRGVGSISRPANKSRFESLGEAYASRERSSPYDGHWGIDSTVEDWKKYFLKRKGSRCGDSRVRRQKLSGLCFDQAGRSFVFVRC